MKTNLLIQNDRVQNQLLNLVVLKSVTQWLEKQNWISSPYGGENYLEDFRSKLNMLNSKEWKALLAEGTPPQHLEEYKKYFEFLKTIDPEIKYFCEKVLGDAQTNDQK